MNTKHVVSGMVIAGLLALASGCGKSDETAGSGSGAPAAGQPAMKQASDAMATAAGKVETTAKTATAAVANAATSATASAQGLLDQAKSYVADKKYQPALDSLQKLSNIQLTPAQQTMVNDLKAQITKLMAAGGTTVSNMIPK